jgi:ABC-type protease/lipase transport system fused ATPase/permease subunit
MAHLPLDAWVGEGGTLLSGGERERVSLARALLKPSELLILDEPTAHLDPETEQRVLEIIAAELAGRALLLVSHRTAPLQLADRVLRLDGGHLSPVSSPLCQPLCQPPDSQSSGSQDTQRMGPQVSTSLAPAPPSLDTPLLTSERTSP